MAGGKITLTNMFFAPMERRNLNGAGGPLLTPGILFTGVTALAYVLLAAPIKDLEGFRNWLQTPTGAAVGITSAVALGLGLHMGYGYRLVKNNAEIDAKRQQRVYDEKFPPRARREDNDHPSLTEQLPGSN